MSKLTSTAALVLGIAAAGAHAAELGEATVRSHAGEQLVADVELVDLTSQDLADLQVRLASRNVFQGANVTMSPALAGINITVTKREQRRVLHLTTSAPIQSEVLHLYFELTSGGRQSVRGVSLWLPAAPPAPPAPVAQPTRVVAAPALAPVVAPQPVSPPRPRPAGVTVQLAAAATPGKQATPAEAELMGAVERAFAARSAGKNVEPAKAPARAVPAVEAKATEKPEPVAKAAEKPAPAVGKIVEKPVADEKKVAGKPAPAEHKVAGKHAPATEKDAGKTAAKTAKVTEKPAVSIVPPLPVIANPTEPVPTKPVADQAMLKKLAELEAKLKSLQAAVAKKAATPPPAPVPPKAPDNKVAATPKPAEAPTPAAMPAQHVEQSAAVVTATEPPGRTAAGKITDARPEKASLDKEPVVKAEAPHEADKPEAKPAPPPETKKAAPPPAEPVKEKKMSRPKVLTMIAAGSVALLLVAGVIVHFVRRRKAKKAREQIKVWQSWRKQAIAEAATSEEEVPATATEAGTA
jgi:pilus assembly protein FimV